MKYFIVFCGILIVFGVGLKINSTRFSIDKMDQIVLGKSMFGSLADNPCTQQVAGDPDTPDKRRIRVSFICSDGVKVNTISYSAVSDTRIKTILWEVARINKFDPEVVYKKWQCTLNSQLVDQNQLIKEDEEIKCGNI